LKRTALICNRVKVLTVNRYWSIYCIFLE